MNTRHFYLDVELSCEESSLTVRRLIEVSAKQLFGECGAAALGVDVLRVQGARALLRVAAAELRRLRAVLALAPRDLRVRAQAPSLLALL